MKLNGKTILVTGASSGIGAETAIACSREGALLILNGRNRERLEKTASRLEGEGHSIIPADLTIEEQMGQLVNNCPELHGIVHSAGITAHMPVNFITHHHINSLIKINFEAPVLLTSQLLYRKRIKSNASIVFISSIATRLAYFGGAIYSASKSALEAYAKTLSLELAPRHIRANIVAPTFVQTEMLEKAEKTISDETMERMKKMHPLGFGQPADVANAIVFFLSDESNWISGTKLELGGLS